jgi:hypothetical protein
LIGRSGDSYRVGYCKVYQAQYLVFQRFIFAEILIFDAK